MFFLSLPVDSTTFAFLLLSGDAVLLVTAAGVTDVRFASRRFAVSVGFAAGVLGFGNRG